MLEIPRSEVLRIPRRKMLEIPRMGSVGSARRVVGKRLD
jgi:hypothetical protein